LNVTVICSRSTVRAFSSVGTRPVTRRKRMSPAKPKNIRPSASALMVPARDGRTASTSTRTPRSTRFVIKVGLVAM
jgi:hypothetical protein